MTSFLFITPAKTLLPNKVIITASRWKGIWGSHYPAQHSPLLSPSWAALSGWPCADCSPAHGYLVTSSWRGSEITGASREFKKSQLTGPSPQVPSTEDVPGETLMRTQHTSSPLEECRGEQANRYGQKRARPGRFWDYGRGGSTGNLLLTWKTVHWQKSVWCDYFGSQVLKTCNFHMRTWTVNWG